MAALTNHFEKRLNSTKREWKLNEQYQFEAEDAIDSAKFKLETGMLAYLTAKREKELSAFILKNCYKNKDYNYLQSQKCEEFHLDNDFKLNAIKKFNEEHLWKHNLSWKECFTNDKFESTESIVEKDRAFLKCHRGWLKNLDSVVPDLE